MRRTAVIAPIANPSTSAKKIPLCCRPGIPPAELAVMGIHGGQHQTLTGRDRGSGISVGPSGGREDNAASLHPPPSGVDGCRRRTVALGGACRLSRWTATGTPSSSKGPGEGRYKRMVLFLERTSSSFFLSYHSQADSHTKTSLSQLLPHLTEVHTKDHWPTPSSSYYLLAPSACSPACCLLPLVKPCHT